MATKTTKVETMNMWHTEPPEPVAPRSVLWCGAIRLSIGPSQTSPALWQYLAMSFGAHTNRSADVSKEAWPREAIRMAREELDRLEEKL